MRYKRCGTSLCLSAADAKKEQQNKVEAIRWINQANALICYYEVREGKEVCSFSGASASK